MKLINVTPGMARQFLASGNLSHIKRPINMNNVRLYANQMKSGEWQVNENVCIAFDIYGNLINGNHRMHSVILSDVTVPFYVSYNNDPEIFRYLDNGRKRSPGDCLKIAGVANYNNVAAGIRIVAKMKNGKFYRGGDVWSELTNSQVLDEYNKMPEFYNGIANESKVLYNKSLKIVAPQAIFGLLAYWRLKGESTKYIEAVFNDDQTVLNAKGLYRFLTNQKIQRKNISIRDIIMLFFKYHSAWKNKTTVGQFILKPDEKIKTF